MARTTKIPGRLESAATGNVVAGANAILDDEKGKKQNVINSEVDAEMVRLNQEKQNVLNFDSVPTEDSQNPVTSGGVYAADKVLSDAIEAILLLIPSAASSLNQLADKNFVNSSISTATATPRGTYNLVSDLDLTTDATRDAIAEKLGEVIDVADLNDYAFVQVPVSDDDPTEIERTERYKFNGNAWIYEYTLNTSGFTAAQWEAINSGITAALVAKLDGLPTAAALELALGTITQNIQNIGALIPSDATAENQLADKAYVLTQILAATPSFKGQFTTLAQLQDVTGAKAGDLGIVRTKDSAGHDVFTFYQYLNNQWNEYYVMSYHPQDKPATTGWLGDYPYNGMGRIELPMNMVDGWPDNTWIYLPKNDVVYLLYSWHLQLYAVYNPTTQEGLGLDDNLVVKPENYDIADLEEIVNGYYLPFTEDGGVWTITKPDGSTITSTELNNTNIYHYLDPSHRGVNVLTQSMMNRGNTIYVIAYDYDLNGETIEFPEGCILDFEGGSLDNGTIILENTGICADRYQIFKDDLNIISYKREIGVPSGLQPERKRTLYATWFGLRGSEDSENADVFAKVLTTLRNNGKLIVDTDIYIEKPVVVRDLFYTIIEGETGNNSINVCIPTIYSRYVPSEETNLFEFYSEGLQLRNLRISWGIGNEDTDGGRNPQAVVYVRPRGGLAEIDCVIENCQIDNYKYGETINAQGRGLYIQNNILHHPFWNSAEVNALIKIVGYSIDDDREFFRPKDGNRATVIKNNRFHVAYNYYMVWFVQDPENPNSTFSNTLIEGNLCDFGCSGIRCDSRMRGLVVTNNIFSVKRRVGNDYSFNYFTNSINGLVFANNVITTVEEPDDGTEINNAGETWFKYTDSNVEFENINISNNTFDIPNMARLVSFDGREYKSQDNEKYPIVRQLNVCNNTFSDRCFVSGSSNWNYICSFLNCSLQNSSITFNCVGDRNEPKDVRSTIFYYIQNENYPTRTIDNKRSIIAMNAGTSLDIIFEGCPPGTFIDFITTNALRPVYSSIPWAFREDTIEGAQMWNILFKRPAWFTNAKWIDCDGYSHAPKRGESADRPNMYLIGSNDNGFTYFDTTINKQIIYKSGTVSFIVNRAKTELDTETNKYKTAPIPNTLVEGNVYMISCNLPYEHHVYFYNSNDPSVQRIDVIEQMRNLGYTSPFVQLNKFVAPDPSVYDTIVMEVEYESEISIVEFEEWWEEQDGAKAGVNRSGNTANRPLGSLVYIGFTYFDTDLGKPIYAKVISGNTVTWVDAIGQSV